MWNHSISRDPRDYPVGKHSRLIPKNGMFGLWIPKNDRTGYSAGIPEKMSRDIPSRCSGFGIPTRHSDLVKCLNIDHDVSGIQSEFKRILKQFWLYTWYTLVNIYTLAYDCIPDTSWSIFKHLKIYRKLQYCIRYTIIAGFSSRKFNLSSFNVVSGIR